MFSCTPSTDVAGRKELSGQHPWVFWDCDLAGRRKALDDAIPATLVMAELPKPRDTFILIRGQYDKKGEKVSAAVPAALGRLPKDAPPNRLGLAKWLVDPNHPLTARVTVNRFCSSSLQAIRMADHAIQAGEGDTFVCGGVESVTRAQSGPEANVAHPQFVGPNKKYDLYMSMGMTAETVAERFDISEDLIMAFWNPSLFLNPQVMDDNDLAYPEVEQALADAMLAQEGVSYAITRTSLENGQVPDTPIMRKIMRAFHPERSGNVLFVQDQFWYLYHNADQFSAMHGSPYAYDTHVPILIAGPDIPHRVVGRSVAVSDLAITTTNYMRVRTPSGADGNLLEEVVSERGL